MTFRMVSVAALATLVMAACGGVVSGPVTPGKTVVAVMQLIRDGKPEELKSLVVADDQIGASMFSGVYSSRWSARGGLERVEVASEEITGDSTTVTRIGN